MSIYDIFYPLWIKRGKIIVAAILFLVLLPICSYLFVSYQNLSSTVYWKQDLKFNTLVPQSQKELIVSDDIIHAAYKENNIEKNYDEVLLLNNTTRYEVLQELLKDSYEDIVIEIVSRENNEKDDSFWLKNLNLEKNYNHISIIDTNLTDTDFQKIMKSIITNFNTIAEKSFRYNDNYISEIEFDEKHISSSYAIDRLLYLKSVLSDNNKKFENLNYDSSEVSFIADSIVFYIAANNEELRTRKINSYKHEISQLDTLASSLNELYNMFYTDTKSLANSSSDAELTVDAISQLIELGKDISQINDRAELIDTIYELNIKKNKIQSKIYDLEDGVNSTESNLVYFSQDETISEARNIINEVNTFIRTFNQSNNFLAVIPIGESYKQISYRISYSVVLYSILISFIFFVIYLLSVIFKYHSNKKHLKIST